MSRIALFNSMQHIRTALIAGERLPSLFERVAYYLELTNTYHNETAKFSLGIHRGTINALIDGSTILAADVPTSVDDVQVLTGLYFHRATQAYWQGYNERCQYFIQKFATLVTFDTIREHFMTFIEGMNSVQLLRMVSNASKNRSVRSQAAIWKTISNAVNILKAAASHSRNASYLVKPRMVPFFACRMVQLTMKNGLCKYSILGFVQFAAMLCNNKFAKMIGSIALATRIGKAAMSCSTKRYHTLEQLPNINLVFYSHIAFRTEPLQTCADMFRQGFDASMSRGETGIALFNSMQHIRTALIAGERLPSLFERVAYYLELTNTYHNETAKFSLGIHRGTINALIDGSTILAADVPTSVDDVQVLTGLYFHRATQAYWQGYNERCQYFIQKFATLVTFDTIREHFMTFIEGMNSVQLLRLVSNGSKNRSVRSQAAIWKTISNAVNILKAAASHSSWNFQNKVHLLEAEMFSLQNKISEACTSYVAAISSASSSGFIHEQGLACELAGFHYKRVNDFRSALTYFDRAKQCYTEWGSQLKVDSITLQLESLSDYMPCGASS
ncbi:hypothetical protein ACHAXA_005007 [Cyclostephanos tholiformis]|uniref:Uncharacterized protein n=1 Tax=Cyclostephanos tholiformis TaxID=382380 RepID=A0ABD3RYS7_9STRA